MSKFYISFGQDHAHSVNGKTFDRNCLCEIEAPTHIEARDKAFQVFGPVFATSYPEKEALEILHYFPRGIIKLEN